MKKQTPLDYLNEHFRQMAERTRPCDVNFDFSWIDPVKEFQKVKNAEKDYISLYLSRMPKQPKENPVENTKKKQTETQNQIIIRMLEKRWITPEDGYKYAKSLSFPKRINEIRKLGYDLESKWVDLPSGKRVKAWRRKK